MQFYEKTIVVKKNDLDELDHVNNVRYVQWIQDISKEHWQSKASKEIQAAVVWVVMNHNISYKFAARLNDIIQIKTHIEKSKGAISIRVVEMFDSKTNRLLIRSSTEWCLLNAKTLKPIRIPQEVQELFSRTN